MEESILLSSDRDEVSLELYDDKKLFTIEEIINTQKRVFNDRYYEIQLCLDDSVDEIETVTVYINDEKVDILYKDGIIEFLDTNKIPFRYIVGFAQIAILIRYVDASEVWKYAEYASVLIIDNSTNRSLDSMLKYIYENQEDILYRDANSTKVERTNSDIHEDFWSQIIMLEDISLVYEDSYSFFMTNARTRLENEYVLDRIEKLQQVDSETLRHIIQYPEYLHDSINGIRYGRQSFLPTKTLMKQNRITIDTYENRVVISFLEYLLEEIKDLHNRIKTYTSLVKTEEHDENGYIVSSYLLYKNAKKILMEFEERVLEVKRRYQKLVTSYSRILDLKRIPMVMIPEPTSVFMNVPQYHRIYTYILGWFRKNKYDLRNERSMFRFTNAPVVYEAYVLIKLINQIKDFGYSLVSQEYVDYPRREKWKYKNQRCNNTFVFTNEDDSKITIYYEPIIYDKDSSKINGIALYRNNSISISGKIEEECHGHYYVPDYLLKYEGRGKEKYYICDAKFSNRRRVQHSLIPLLMYKYINSISECKSGVELLGLGVFYALIDEKREISSFYNCQISSMEPITPYVDMIPLSEENTYYQQNENAKELLKKLVD